MATTNQQLAEACVAELYNRDPASKTMGMTVAEVKPGFARVTMTVRGDMLNGHATCHGGFVFSLADSTFAFACNTGNQATVASGCSIEYVAPAREGDLLTATAEKKHRSGRLGVYDITVTNQNNEVVAYFRGKSYQTKQPVLPVED
ncbi:hydroxyphenylacetyl-CoA thioesterase PaaI [Porticoccus sp. W117]|uniref:hydroxyphenylacetyl-CoA thioesterase PaaI n=1 Tax=Porticoccus sp. W117 TaxID=3054777 RepID=UPI0025940D0F|nr:hydroxyphenylacetyl-CoA thioesterase PaaI [Porticoccus sp. W117]MDM3872501.1 hydroxyphenylacetyl-CoA thioesterase PaaI [Porticoccus sp. W117]